MGRGYEAALGWANEGSKLLLHAAANDEDEPSLGWSSSSQITSLLAAGYSAGNIREIDGNCSTTSRAATRANRAAMRAITAPTPAATSRTRTGTGRRRQ